MVKRKRRKFSASFKTKVVLESLKEQKSIREIASQFEVHPNQISKWKQQFLSNSEKAFEGTSTTKNEKELEREKMLQTIGQQKVEIDFLKHVLGE